jgi:acyl-CoA synthetase (AMP-forming)/AMP-acid ligase II
MLEAQIQSLVKAWKWSESDRILHVLPLHHVHGIVNVGISSLVDLWIAFFLHEEMTHPHRFVGFVGSSLRLVVRGYL